MAEKVSLKDYKRSYRQIMKEVGKRGFLLHLGSYVTANVALAALNVLYQPEYIWFYWPLIGWGIGVLFHYLYGVRFLDRRLDEREAMAEYMAGQK